MATNNPFDLLLGMSKQICLLPLKALGIQLSNEPPSVQPSMTLLDTKDSGMPLEPGHLSFSAWQCGIQTTLTAQSPGVTKAPTMIIHSN